MIGRLNVPLTNIGEMIMARYTLSYEANPAECSFYEISNKVRPDLYLEQAVSFQLSLLLRCRRVQALVH